MALSDTYRALGDGKSNLSLLEDISQRPEGRWACARLGLQYWDLGDTSAAINCLRAALKSDPDNSHMWEALADAYMARGANGSALKSYQKVLELKPGAFYPALQIATIKQMTELADESLLEFRELVMAQPASPLALKGLCETCLYLAREHLTTRLMGLARDRLQEGLIAIASAVQLRPDLACLWKLAGECLTLAGSLPRSWHYLTVPEVLRSKSASEATQQGLQLLQLGARCLCRCLKLMSGEGQAAVWHDLALNYRQQVELSDTRDGICQRALAAAKESVTLDPGSWQHWNQLGIVAALPEVRKFKLAQHAFIKATMLDNTVAAPWSNLGCFVLKAR
ncbi:tetratricopeptide repeat protein 37-like [Homalodisca vitripennis]|uniref:tetratricopeptide repeat protein 37-like n=1 Tax=Homalodisca vitripennis TaxID=197043 RepID=UPI001EEA790F|nr:tetratricopeptide repeat protein 37-like [Homalodisca vitripennis]